MIAQWFAKYAKAAMSFRENINGRSKRAYKQACTVINIFHGVNLILYTVTKIYPKVGILLEYYQYFS